LSGREAAESRRGEAINQVASEAPGEPHPVQARPRHHGNPAYETLLRVPLIVAPPFFEETGETVRGIDLRNMVRLIAGLQPLTTSGSSGPLYVGEPTYRTHRQGRYKSMWPRIGDAPLLFDLEADPGERRNLASDQPHVLDLHRERIEEAARQLATQRVGSRDEDSPEDLERLRARGYIE